MEMSLVISLLTLTALELVLGIDNIVLLSIVVEKLPAHERGRARQIGLALALVFRVILLSMVTWLVALTETLFTVAGNDISARDLILLIGGFFLIGKATTEIYNFVELKDEHGESHLQKGATTFFSAIVQIIIFDLIFSLDSVLTAVGLTQNLTIMIAAVVISAVLMVVFAKYISDFVHENPAIKMLALSFLVLIGVLLVGEGMGQHFDRGYVYFAMAFSLGIELLNRRRSKRVPRT